MTKPIHTRDSDCTLGADLCCTECGVSHADPCPDCDGAGFHWSSCGEYDDAEDAEDAALTADWTAALRLLSDNGISAEQVARGAAVLTAWRAERTDSEPTTPGPDSDEEIP